MSYRTTCPHCDSVFRVGPDQLDAAQGWVQCGVCGAAFDARASLLTEDGSPLPVVPASAQTVEVEPTPAEAVPAAEAPAETAAPASEAPVDAPASPEPAAAAAATPVGIAQREAASDLSSIILIDPDIPVPDDYGAMPQIPAAQASGSGMPLMYPPPGSHEPAARTTPAARIEYSKPVYPASQAGAPNLRRAPPSAYVPPARRRSRPWVWGGASVLLLALLLMQFAYFLRDTLVSQLPQTRPALERMCELAGCTFSLPKDLALLQIVGSDLETEANGALKLTLTLGNRADHAQAWPVLVLTLTDQRNQPLARRSFAPSEYLGDARRIAAGMPPRSEQPLSLPLTVHGIKPMGFDLQLVY